MDDELLEFNRAFLKDSLRRKIDFSRTDQNRGVPPPPLEKPIEPDSRRVFLPRREEWEKVIRKVDVLSAITNRESRRNFSEVFFTLDELAFLLWSTQGIKSIAGPGVSIRTVPSAGARHSFETYLFVRTVSGIERGLYRYLPVEHELLFIKEIERMEIRLEKACLGQRFIGTAAVTFVWATIPYRMEWRYAHCAHRVILMDAGHVCQNLYLACEAVGAGTCAVAAYDQEEMDRLIGLDGRDEFVVYLAPVGKI
jgi:SagB-type dehydrogenase family enzyme